MKKAILDKVLDTLTFARKYNKRDRRVALVYTILLGVLLLAGFVIYKKP